MMPFNPKYKIGDILHVSNGDPVEVTSVYPTCTSSFSLSVDKTINVSEVTYAVKCLNMSIIEVIEEDLAHPASYTTSVASPPNWRRSANTGISCILLPIVVGDKIKFQPYGTCEVHTAEVVRVDAISLVVKRENSTQHEFVVHMEILSFYKKGDRVKFKGDSGTELDGTIIDVIAPGTFGWHESYEIKKDDGTIKILDHTDIISVQEGTGATASTGHCWHEWKEYIGLFEVDHYCTKCGKKRESK